MSHLIQTIDRRIAKFTVLSKKKGYSYTKNIKLDPLAHVPSGNITGQFTPKSNETMLPEIQHSSSLNSNQIDNRSLIETRKTNTKRWKNLLATVLSSQHSEGRWFNFLIWKRAFSRGIRTIASMRRTKIDASRTIKKYIKMILSRNEFHKRRKAARLIQRSWKRHIHRKKEIKRAVSIIYHKWIAYRERKTYLKIVKATQILALFFKIKFAIKNKAAVLLHANWRGLRERRLYRPLVLKALRARKHQLMLKRQVQAVQARKRQTAAVKVIENAYQNHLYRKKLREYRKYLWTLPYECRLLYLKFKQVKRDADSLKADVENMIAKKQADKLREAS